MTFDENKSPLMLWDIQKKDSFWWMLQKYIEQAGAELGQAQLKLGLGFTSTIGS